MKKLKHSFLLIFASLIWGVAFVAQSEGGDVIGPYSFNCIRSIIAAIFLFIVMKIFNKFQPNTKKDDPKTLIKASLYCGLSLSIASIVQQLGITYGNNVGKAGFLTACYIVIVPILGLFIKRKCDWNVWVSVMLCLMGLYLLCIHGSFEIEYSDGLLMLCALLYSFQILFVDHFAPLVNGIKLSCIQFFVCFIISFIPSFIFEMKDIQAWIQPFLQLDAWIPLLYAGILSSGIAYTIQIISQKELHPTVASLLMSLESVFSVLAGWLLLNQQLSSRELLGCFVIFAAVILAQIPMRKRI